MNFVNNQLAATAFTMVMIGAIIGSGWLLVLGVIGLVSSAILMGD